uniref:Uncharacterized protein n=1 Tax=Rhizophora mucronata TaxID=61149 RepID=A0A2P2PYL6_RHIMU
MSLHHTTQSCSQKSATF